MSKKFNALVFAGTALVGLGVVAADAAPVRVASPSALGIADATIGTASQQVAYRRYGGRRYYGGGRRYYGNRGYNPAGAAVAGAALGLLGAGVAAATAPSYGYYPAYGYGGGYGYPGYGYGYRGW